MRGNVWLGTLDPPTPVHLALFELAALSGYLESIRLSDAVMDVELSSEPTAENALPFDLANAPTGARSLVAYVLFPDAAPEFRVGLATELIEIDEDGVEIGGLPVSSVDLFFTTTAALRE